MILSRGTVIKSGLAIRKTLAEGDTWEICSATGNATVLAVETAVYEHWKKCADLPDGLFLHMDSLPSYRIYVSSADSLIGSLRNGPYPSTTNQIAAFSDAFREANRKKLLDGASDCIYIEEHALLLPLHDAMQMDADLLYGQWVTGGVAVRASSFAQISPLMAWMPKELFRNYLKAAGIEPDENRRMNIAEETPETRKKREQSGFAKGELFELPGRPALESFFRDNIIEIVKHRDAYARMGVSFPGATVLYGPSGTGKSFGVERLADYLGWPKFYIDSGSIGSTYLHETSKKISEVFQAAEYAAPSILIIDEMEAFLSQRSGAANGSHIYHMEEVAEFLRRIPSAQEKGVLIFAMTNMLDSIDPAVLRRGRFDHIILVDYASKDEIAKLLEKRFQDLPIDDDVRIDPIARALASHPLSDVTFVLKEAGRLAAKQGLEAIDRACFQEALRALSGKKDDRQRHIGF